VDVLTSTSNNVFKICKEQGLCPLMESPCEKEIFDERTLTKNVIFFHRIMGFIPGKGAKNVTSQIVCNDEIPNPQGTIRGKPLGKSPLVKV
jgi:hypothetical protein